jgi:hypothetical protein
MGVSPTVTSEANSSKVSISDLEAILWVWRPSKIMTVQFCSELRKYPEPGRLSSLRRMGRCWQILLQKFENRTTPKISRKVIFREL